jgi:single-strand DNA-binding protein
VNKVISSTNRGIVTVTGNVGQPPILGHMDDGQSVLNFSLATEGEVFVNEETGEVIAQPTWYRIGVFGAAAQTLLPLIKQGQRISIVGALRERTVERDGVLYDNLDVRATRFNLKGEPMSLTDAEVAANERMTSDVETAEAAALRA